MLPLVARPDPTKAALRSRVLAARAALSPETRAALGAALGDRLLALPEVSAARTVAGYVGVGTEPPTLPWLDALRARGVTVLLPLLRPDSSLDWGTYGGVLVDGRLGLREPLVGGESLPSADVVVVPGVAYDAAGNRLGRGGGSYDRALSSVTVPVVGLALDDEVVPVVPVAAHDRRVDVVVTPTRVLRVAP
jgi:5-formyltetrahydrofolate cyclo-ligase